MAKKSGILAEINRQQKLAAKRRAAAEREQAATAKKLEQAQRAEEKARAAAIKADAAEQKRLEKVAKEAHIATQMAEVDALNNGLAEEQGILGGILAATLDVDDHVDLESLRRVAQPLSSFRLDLQPQPAPPTAPPPPKPVFVEPETPSGVGRVLGKSKHAEEVKAAQDQHAANIRQWEAAVSHHQAAQEQALAEHQLAEETRASELRAAHAAHLQEVEQSNQEVEALIANLGYGVEEAIEEYVSIVVSNSLYPEEFDVSHEFEFSGETAELSIQAIVPSPEAIPTIRAYKYVKASNEITTTDLSNKARKDLYASAIDQVALRTLHEIFEADRRGLIQTISLEVGTTATSPATGLPEFMPFVAVSAARDDFLQFDLSAVLPSATLEHLGAAVSKNALGLVSANTTGVRKAA